MLASVLLLACTGEGGTDDTDPSTASWEVVMHDLDATLLSVYAPSSDNVWAVGSNPGDGLGGYAFRWDGEEWERLDTGDAGVIWWADGDDAGHVCSSEMAA